MQGTATPVKDNVVIKKPVPRQDWQLNHEQVKLYEKVGAGAFGEVRPICLFIPPSIYLSQVYRGVLIDGINTTEVAVKTHKAGGDLQSDRKARLEFLKEARQTDRRIDK